MFGSIVVGTDGSDTATQAVRQATELARACGVPMPIAALVEQDLIQALGRGWGQRDASSVFLLQEERAGVAVRATG